ncbi:MAG: sigma-54-dependent Fis family transcriptional regulator [Candidatus Rokubacteria bacterium]|nr:sigma-54-dependent Fis family transcriptional regulator [Candidatus Rokubacteria bacterium]
MTKARIFVVDNDAGMVAMLVRHLEGEGYDVTSATDGDAARRVLAAQTFDVVLTDLVMDEVDGLTLLKDAQASPSRPRVLLMTAFGSLETAIEAMREGAFDYLTKPFRLAQVTVAVRRALDDRRLREENRRLREQVERLYGVEQLVGTSRAMRAVVEQIRAIAATDAAVLLLGESGTGKELVARAIHGNSARRDGPFVPVNCAAIPETLLESELFGHVKGAFTGADRPRRGLFAEATGGTLFLDEIGDMPLALQAKLLRVLQDKAVRPVGGSQEIQLDLRVISATNRDVAADVGEGRFREDLYYRLAVIPIRLPSLRERPDDVPLLARHFLNRAGGSRGRAIDGFTDEALDQLSRHRWPGNVRELENVIERAATLARGPLITPADLGLEIAAPGPVEAASRPTLNALVDRYIDQVLAESGGDKQRAARVLGISVRTLQRRARPE